MKMQYSLCSTVYCSSTLQDVDIPVLKIIYPVYMYIHLQRIQKFYNVVNNIFDLEIRALLESDTDSLKTLRMPLWGSSV